MAIFARCKFRATECAGVARCHWRQAHAGIGAVCNVYGEAPKVQQVHSVGFQVLHIDISLGSQRWQAQSRLSASRMLLNWLRGVQAHVWTWKVSARCPPSSSPWLLALVTQIFSGAVSSCRLQALWLPSKVRLQAGMCSPHAESRLASQLRVRRVAAVAASGDRCTATKLLCCKCQPPGVQLVQRAGLPTWDLESQD